MKSQLIGKDPDAGKDGGQEQKRATEDEMVGWHHRRNGYESEQTPGEWRTEEPGKLQSTGWQRCGHSLTTEQQKEELPVGSVLRESKLYLGLPLGEGAEVGS